MFLDALHVRVGLNQAWPDPHGPIPWKYVADFRRSREQWEIERWAGGFPKPVSPPWEAYHCRVDENNGLHLVRNWGPAEFARLAPVNEHEIQRNVAESRLYHSRRDWVGEQALYGARRQLF